MSRGQSGRAPQARRLLAALVPVGIFVLALAAMHGLRADLRLHDILAEYRAIDTWRIAAAIGLAGASYLALTVYERLALAYVGVQLPWRRYALTSFISYAIGNNVGIGAVSGAAVRYRLYSSQGIRAGDIGAIVAFCTITFTLGIATLAGVSLVAHAGEAATLLHASTTVSTSLGIALLGVVALYLGACASRRAPPVWRGWRLPLPSAPVALAQVAIACVDLLLASACAYVLLPATAEVSFVAFAGLYMVAVAISVSAPCPAASACSSRSWCCCCRECRPRSCSAPCSLTGSCTTCCRLRSHWCC